jgi:hypothetical protein
MTSYDLNASLKKTNEALWNVLHRLVDRLDSACRDNATLKVRVAALEHDVHALADMLDVMTELVPDHPENDVLSRTDVQLGEFFRLTPSPGRT